MTDDAPSPPPPGAAPKLASTDVVQAAAHLRKLLHGLEKRIVPTLSNRAIEDSARRLGMWKNGGAVVDQKEDFGVILDYAVHHYRTIGKPAVERFEGTHGAEMPADERAVLRALIDSRFTIIELRGGRGPASVDAFDMLYDEVLLLVDPTLVEDRPGRVFAARVVPLGRFAMTTSAVISLEVEQANAMRNAVKGSLGAVGGKPLANASPAERAKVEAQLIAWGLGTHGPR